MIATIQRLCRLLESPSVTVDSLATGLGTVVPTGEAGSLNVTPADPELSSARVVREPGTDAPAFLELVPREPGTLSVETLSEALGEYTTLPRIHWSNPRRIIFHLASSGAEYTCAVIADVQPGPTGLADGNVSALTLRRDRRLD